MAGRPDEIQQTDITRFGVAAVVAVALGFVSLTLASLVPASISVGLHSTRLDGANLNLLREQLAYLQTQQDDLRRTNNRINSRVRLNQNDQDEVNRRLSALEVAIPDLLEAIPPDVEVDRSIQTGSIGDEDRQSFDAEGGTVTVRHSPMFPEGPAAGPPDLSQQMPEPPPDLASIDAAAPDTPLAGTGTATLTATRYGLAIGDMVTGETADAAWKVLQSKVGSLLIGFQTALSDPVEAGSMRIIVGPINDYAAAESLCLRVARNGVPCLPVQYAGDKLMDFAPAAAVN